jgi:hypothetical protein
VDPTAGLEDVEKINFLTLPGYELRPFGRPAVASRYTDCALPPLYNYMYTVVKILHYYYLIVMVRILSYINIKHAITFGHTVS